MQESTNLQVTHALKMSWGSGWWQPVILVNGAEEETQKGLEAVFQMHDAPLVDVGEGVPDELEAVGDCTVLKDNAVITVRGTGGTFMGMRFETQWGPVHVGWREEVRRLGHVWFGLLTAEQFAASLAASTSLGPGELPRMPLLKLEASFR